MSQDRNYQPIITRSFHPSTPPIRPAADAGAEGDDIRLGRTQLAEVVQDLQGLLPLTPALAGAQAAVVADDVRALHLCGQLQSELPLPGAEASPAGNQPT